MSLSRITISGEVQSKPEKRMTPSNVPVTNVRILVSYIGRGMGQDGERQLSSQSIKINAWRDLADVAEGLSPGDKIIVSGRAQINSYTNQEGIKKREIEVDATSLTKVENLLNIETSTHKKSKDSELDFENSGLTSDLNTELNNVEEIPF